MDAARHSPSKSCYTVHTDAAAGFLSELGVEQLEPVVHDLGGRRGAIIEGPVLEKTKEEECQCRSETYNKGCHKCVCTLTRT